MKVWMHPVLRRAVPLAAAVFLMLLGAGLTAPAAVAQQTVMPTDDAPQVAHRPGGEANLVIPDLSQVSFGGIPGSTLLMFGLLVCAAGLLFGLVIYSQLKRMPVHCPCSRSRS
jgi:hypothetical protein